MDGGNGGSWVSVSLSGLLAMSDEVFKVLYCRHGGGLTWRIGNAVAEELPTLTTAKLEGRGATSRQTVDVGR